MKNRALLFADNDWGLIGESQDGSSLMTTLSIVEGALLTFLEEEQGETSVQDAINHINYPATLLLMAVGSLVRRRLILATKMDTDILLETVPK
jgi:hypothetical protein